MAVCARGQRADTNQRFRLTYNSIPAPGACVADTFPMVLHIPAGSVITVQAYSFANNTSICSAYGCVGNVTWTLQ